LEKLGVTEVQIMSTVVIAAVCVKVTSQRSESELFLLLDIVYMESMKFELACLFSYLQLALW